FYKIFFVQSILEVALLYQFLVGKLLIKEHALSSDVLMSFSSRIVPEYWYHGTVYFFVHVQIFGVIIQSLSRLINICAPRSRARQFLGSTPIFVWFLISTIVPFAMLFRLLLQEPIRFIPNSDGNAFLYIPPHVTKTNAMQATIVTIIGTMLSVSCYAAQRFEMKCANCRHILYFRRELRFTLVGSIHVLSLCTMTAYYILVTSGAASRIPLPIARDIYMIPVLMMTFTSGWMLTLTHTRLRRR
ncbi:hypothetical protein PENTCL1PPCAC_23994, partial [Pristionchus entomophagus]